MTVRAAQKELVTERWAAIDGRALLEIGTEAEKPLAAAHGKWN